MNKDVIESDNSQSIKSEKISFFKRCWQGQLPLWRAFWLVHIIGTLLAVVLGLVPQYVFWLLADVSIPLFVSFIPVLLILPFTLVCLWHASPHPKLKIKGAFARIWVILGSIYYLMVCFRFVSFFATI